MYDLKQLRELAAVVVKSGLWQHLRSIDAVLALMLMGADYGLSPMASVAQLHVVSGKPTLSAGAQAAIAKRGNRYTWTVDDISDDRCLLTFMQRTDAGWHKLGPAEFTYSEAQRAGLTRNSTWTKYRQDLLFARALSRGCRRYCPDQFSGTAYVEGEIDTAPGEELTTTTSEELTTTSEELTSAAPFDCKRAAEYALKQGADYNKALAEARRLAALDISNVQRRSDYNKYLQAAAAISHQAQ